MHRRCIEEEMLRLKRKHDYLRGKAFVKIQVHLLQTASMFDGIMVVLYTSQYHFYMCSK